MQNNTTVIDNTLFDIQKFISKPSRYIELVTLLDKKTELLNTLYAKNTVSDTIITDLDFCAMMDFIYFLKSFYKFAESPTWIITSTISAKLTYANFKNDKNNVWAENNLELELFLTN